MVLGAGTGAGQPAGRGLGAYASKASALSTRSWHSGRIPRTPYALAPSQPRANSMPEVSSFFSVVCPRIAYVVPFHSNRPAGSSCVRAPHDRGAAAVVAGSGVVLAATSDVPAHPASRGSTAAMPRRPLMAVGRTPARLSSVRVGASYVQVLQRIRASHRASSGCRLQARVSPRGCAGNQSTNGCDELTACRSGRSSTGRSGEPIILFQEAASDLVLSSSRSVSWAPYSLDAVSLPVGHAAGSDARGRRAAEPARVLPGDPAVPLGQPGLIAHTGTLPVRRHEKPASAGSR